MNKLLKLLAALIAVTGIAFADTANTTQAKSLSVSGFVDMSYSDGDNGKESTSGIDQVEIDFTFNNGGPVTGQLDIDYSVDYDSTAKTSLTTVNIEEAYLDYALTEGGIVTVGRFETMLLQDASEPTGLYQYSNAYDFFGVNFNQALYDRGDQGIKYSNGGFAVSLVDNGNDKIGDGNTTTITTTTPPTPDGRGDYAYEISYSGKLTDNLTGFIGGRFTEFGNNNDGDALNLYLTYEEGPWVAGTEFVRSDASYSTGAILRSDILDKLSNVPNPGTTSLDSVDLDLFSLFANYSYSESNSVTVRYSDLDGDARSAGVTYDVDANKLTLAHNSALSEDLALVLEYSKEESNHQVLDQDVYAVELLYAF